MKNTICKCDFCQFSIPGLNGKLKCQYGDCLLAPYEIEEILDKICKIEEMDKYEF